MSKLVVLRRCATLEEALVVDSLLQDGGFLLSTPARFHAQNNWFLVPALNGVPVFIPEAQLREAAKYLIEMRASAKERLESEFGEIDPQPWKRRPLRRWSLFAKEAGIFPLLWFVWSWMLSLLPASLFSNTWAQTLSEDGSTFIFSKANKVIYTLYIHWTNYLLYVGLEIIILATIYGTLMWFMILLYKRKRY